MPVSPPLGLCAGLPVETAELQLTEGSRLVLHTDGLVETRDRDLGTGLRLLAGALSRPDRTPEQDCQAVLDALLPDRPSDDIALLVARTRLTDPDRVADWDVPSDPAAIASLRATAARRLDAWGLDEISFTTELILSELVTNAIRHGSEPIQLRLLFNRDSLICEVADGSSTSPHMRRAATTDEGVGACSSSPSTPGAGESATPPEARSSGANSPWRPPRPTWTKPWATPCSRSGTGPLSDIGPSPAFVSGRVAHRAIFFAMGDWCVPSP